MMRRRTLLGKMIVEERDLPAKAAGSSGRYRGDERDYYFTILNLRMRARGVLLSRPMISAALSLPLIFHFVCSSIWGICSFSTVRSDFRLAPSSSTGFFSSSASRCFAPDELITARSRTFSSFRIWGLGSNRT